MTSNNPMANEWKVHTRGTFEEILENHETQILKQPLHIMYNILQQIAKRGLELDDPEINKLMVRLALYSFADPYSKDYNSEIVDMVMKGKSLKQIAKQWKTKQSKEQSEK